MQVAITVYAESLRRPRQAFLFLPHHRRLRQLCHQSIMARQQYPHAAGIALVILAAAMLAALPGAEAHGFMSQPASRNYIHSTFYPRTAAEKAAIDESYWDVRHRLGVVGWGGGQGDGRQKPGLMM